MNILIISQCSKRARQQSCHILDQFAERTGDSTWQTTITLEGVTTLRKLLCKSARRNTAIACHWLKKNGQSELLWIVGNLRSFNAQGRVPTNRTTLDIVRQGDEHHWHSAESIALLASVAGLFHDFGKAGKSFQKSVLGETSIRFQPYRHEWLSVRLFQAFVGEQSDEQWLKKLGDPRPGDERAILRRLKKDHPAFSDSPLRALPPLAKTVAWLILSHHRLPQSLNNNDISLQYCDGWLDRQLNADWNALNHLREDWKPQAFKTVWMFPQGTPLQSRTWCEKARQIARRVQHAASLNDFGSLDQLFTVHMARLTLMLADHFYSSQPPRAVWQDSDYDAWANSDRATGKRKQKLDEHNAGVAHHALLLGRSLPRVRRTLPAIARHKGFRERAKDVRYQWQNKAWDVATALQERSEKQGFFGVNMASTGCGKTFANARIMYALAKEQEGCRFTVALGLRTLTLQTGLALQSRLGLDSDNVAVMIGSQAVKERHQDGEKALSEHEQGSASAEAFFENHQYVHFEGSTDSGPLHQWLAKDARLNRLVNAPILVTTIDHLIPATEGVRGGKQIPAMLRLLTSDLVLDEPDDFDNADLYAVCRLINWAGMLGSRVLLSSATLPPALMEALFAAYRAGREAYQRACGEPGLAVNICCAWFDEYGAQSADVSGEAAFRDTHQAFAMRRATRLPHLPQLRAGKLTAVEAASSNREVVITSVADALLRQMVTLHHQHHQYANGKTVSLGLVRLANINPLVAVAQVLMAMSPPKDVCIHYCVYHSQHPLAARSYIEKRLDEAFTRHHPEQLWQLAEIKQAVDHHPAKHHLFVVLGTSVIEVGRDWDADWGIIEPSSMRSLIQFAGRIQRHRQQPPATDNLVILSKNIRAMRAITPAYAMPGFETATQTLQSHDLHQLMPEASWRTLNAIPRITDEMNDNAFAALEHRRLRAELLDNSDSRAVVAAQWWRSPITWSGELQRRTPFRRSQPEEQFFMHMADEDDAPVFKFITRQGDWKPSDIFQFCPLMPAEGVLSWFDVDYRDLLLNLAEAQNREVSTVSARYGEIRLRKSDEGAVDDWRYHPQLGVFRALR